MRHLIRQQLLFHSRTFAKGTAGDQKTGFVVHTATGKKIDSTKLKRKKTDRKSEKFYGINVWTCCTNPAQIPICVGYPCRHGIAHWFDGLKLDSVSTRKRPIWLPLSQDSSLVFVSRFSFLFAFVHLLFCSGCSCLRSVLVYVTYR